jgi:hypothetical protein
MLQAKSTLTIGVIDPMQMSSLLAPPTTVGCSLSYASCSRDGGPPRPQ